ncbi:amidohydrolase [Arcticibacter svalbardensis MN12-7]|uniref:Amidohydrolase n=1 Tax=Arcticibacter svalbardensis MN12-7 TaxID=1150600 RepID=R9H1C1_9SPHI|nr:amidohydrolase family protein [Arcticibacter svalbardensis]EOR95024.1 amidohydrolase [Arcticibacter svalbardensis MN12-7]
MNTYYSADYILTASGPSIQNGYLELDDNNVIQGIYEEDELKLSDTSIVKRFKGILVPGFINTHCHLELSWLKGKMDKQKGLIPFIQEVMSKSRSRTDDYMEAMQIADQRMVDNGIVAVGDVSNTIDSRDVKLKSTILYHTFVEAMGFNPEKAKNIFRSAVELNESFTPLKSSIVPHAPYSISKELLRFIGHFCGQSESLMSIHNQESEEENSLFRYKKGLFLDFYKGMDLNIDFFKAQARSSIQSILPHLSKKQKILLVHNTYTTLKDIYSTKRTDRDVFWCFCPNANLYIENTLPKVDLFIKNDLVITLGTDSLASNDDLCILSELKTLHHYFPSLNLEQTIKWATINGARFLNIDANFGSFTVGKSPGINLITQAEGLQLSDASSVQKIV